MSFLFEATEQSQQRKRVVERVAARNGDSIENGIVVYLGDDTGEFSEVLLFLTCGNHIFVSFV